MYLSHLLINIGDNPDRERPGRSWLRNLYRVHQRLCMGFPSSSRKSDDEDFLKPFKPEDFGNDQVHVTRAEDSGFLFRIDPQSGGRAVILVQSAVKPDWEYAFHNAGYLLASPPQIKLVEPCFKEGQLLRFRLVANPTRRLSKHSLGADGRPIERGIGKRVPVPTDLLLDWLARRAEKSGFSFDKDSTTIQPGYVYFGKLKKRQQAEMKTDQEAQRESHEGRLRSVRYEGILRVTDPCRFLETVIHGVGPSKAIGFGLLSVAPCAASLPEEAP